MSEDGKHLYCIGLKPDGNFTINLFALDPFTGDTDLPRVNFCPKWGKSAGWSLGFLAILGMDEICMPGILDLQHPDKRLPETTCREPCPMVLKKERVLFCPKQIKEPPFLWSFLLLMVAAFPTVYPQFPLIRQGCRACLSIWSYSNRFVPSAGNLEIWVEPGTFTMGQAELPHPSIMSQSIERFRYLGKYEVTQANYEAVMSGNTLWSQPNPDF